VLQVIYECGPRADATAPGGRRLFVGQQVDVFIEAAQEGGQSPVAGAPSS